MDQQGINEETIGGWHDTPRFFDDTTTTIGALNDENSLYIRIVTIKQDLERQVIRQGLTFWFDRDGGEKKKLGIHFPLGYDRYAVSRGARRDGNVSGGAPRRDSVEIPVNDIEILGPGEGDRHRMAIAEAKGFDAWFRTMHDTLIYSLKVPISSSGYFPYTIGTRPGTTIGVGIESASASPMGSREGESGGGGRRGGVGGRGMGGRGGMGGFGGGGRPANATDLKPLKIWGKLKLAIHDSPPH